MAMHSKMFQISDGLDDALGNFAAELNEPASEIMRKAIAQYIGYDLVNEVKPPRIGKKYNSEAERKAANTQRQKRRNKLKKDLVEAYRLGDTTKVQAILDELAGPSEPPDPPTNTTNSPQDEEENNEEA